MTRYIFPAFSFSAVDNDLFLLIPGIESRTEMTESAWIVYLVTADATGRVLLYIHIPGKDSHGYEFSVIHYWDPSGTPKMLFWIELNNPPSTGEYTYDRIEIVRIEATDTVTPDVSSESIIPDHLDISNYREVAEYFGFNNKR